MPGRQGNNLEVELENILVREVVLNSPAILYSAHIILKTTQRYSVARMVQSTLQMS
jgi:hypothetical protein